jgi:cytochrome c-type biogenesis protein CcmH
MSASLPLDRAQRSRQRWGQALRRPSVLAALLVLLALVGVWTVTFVIAAQPKSLDERTHEVASELRCPVCNGETVADSSTPVAQQMRALIRQRLQAGESEQQILDEFRASYGDGILAVPPPSGFALFIWLGPVAMLALGGVIVALAGRDWRAATVTADSGGEVEAVGMPALDATDLQGREALDLLRRQVAMEEGLPLGGGRDGGEEGRAWR